MGFAVAEDQELVLPPLEERPLVTFALFAYNQEKYIREAVEGAFAQTYEPLEIILSDDCSTDRTFEIMEEMAASYRGPHRVLVRQSPQNRRLLGHINDVVAGAQGEIVIMAAGDDISLPDRTSELVKIYVEWPITFAACSDFFPMGDVPIPFEDQTEKSLREFTLFRHLANVGGWGRGACYSYRKECFYWPTEIPEFIEIEDRVLPTRAALLGKVAFHKSKLVRYRTPGETGQLEQKRRWQRSKALSPIVNHLISILSIARAQERISALEQRFFISLLRLGFRVVTTENSKDGNSPRLNKFFTTLIKITISLFLRMQRFFDFYSPILPPIKARQ